MKLRFARAWAWVGLWGVAASCATHSAEVPESLVVAREWKREGLTVVRETSHLLYRHSPARGIPDRDTRIAEEHVVRVADRLGIDPPDRLLYLVVSRDWMKERAGHPGRSEALTRPGIRSLDVDLPFDGVILSASARNLHEITHCVSSLLIPEADYLLRTPLIFEGLAVAWEGRSKEFLDERVRELWATAGPLDPGDLIAEFPWDADPPRLELAYQVSGSFVAHLLEDHGVIPIRKLFETGRKDRFHSVFARLYGIRFEEAVRSWAGRVGIGLVGGVPPGT